MNLLENYKKKNNYIGNADWQYKITNYFYKSCSGINYTAFIHDNLYSILWKEKYLFSLIISKICFDIIFLVVGIIRSLRNLETQGVLISILLYFALLFSTPYYIYQMRKSKSN